MLSNGMSDQNSRLSQGFCNHYKDTKIGSLACQKCKFFKDSVCGSVKNLSPGDHYEERQPDGTAKVVELIACKKCGKTIPKRNSHDTECYVHSLEDQQSDRFSRYSSARQMATERQHVETWDSDSGL